MKRLWRQNTDTGAKCSGRRETPATIPAVHTVLLSDLHLGSLTGSDLAARPAARRRLAESVAGADRVVFLGDLLELRERRLAEALALAQPLFDALAEAVAGRQVVLVPGNHDHALAEPWLGRLRLEGRPLGSENEWRVEAGDGLAGRLSALLPEADVTLAYPGLFLRPDVYATHGHYLDLHLTVPRLESIAATAMGRLTRRGGTVASAGDYEAVLAPMYAFYDGLAEAAPPSALRRGGALSRGVWERVNGDGRVARLLLGRVTIPAAVAALNRLGLGPLRPELTGEELRRAGLAAMGRVADVLAPEARARAVRPHPPPRTARGRRRHRLADARGRAAVEHRHLAARGVLRAGSRPAQPLLARNDPVARRHGRTQARERVGGVAGVTQLVAVEPHATGGSGRGPERTSAWPPAESRTLLPLG